MKSQGWTPNPIGLHIKKRDTRRKAMWGQGKKAAVYKPGREASPETNPTSQHLDLGLPPPELRENKFVSTTKTVVFGYGSPRRLIQPPIQLFLSVIFFFPVLSAKRCGLQGFEPWTYILWTTSPQLWSHTCSFFLHYHQHPLPISQVPWHQVKQDYPIYTTSYLSPLTTYT